jgi:hypothetical protein
VVVGAYVRPTSKEKSPGDRSSCAALLGTGWLSDHVDMVLFSIGLRICWSFVNSSRLFGLGHGGCWVWMAAMVGREADQPTRMTIAAPTIVIFRQHVGQPCAHVIARNHVLGPDEFFGQRGAPSFGAPRRSVWPVRGAVCRGGFHRHRTSSCRLVVTRTTVTVPKGFDDLWPDRTPMARAPYCWGSESRPCSQTRSRSSICRAMTRRRPGKVMILLDELPAVSDG